MRALTTSDLCLLLAGVCLGVAFVTLRYGLLMPACAGVGATVCWWRWAIRPSEGKEE